MRKTLYLEYSLVVEEEVGCLQISVQDPVIVKVVDGTQQL